MYYTSAESHTTPSEGLAGALFLREIVYQGCAYNVSDKAEYNAVFDPRALSWELQGLLRRHPQDDWLYSAGRLFDLDRGVVSADIGLSQGHPKSHAENLEFLLNNAQGQHFDLDLVIVRPNPKGGPGKRTQPLGDLPLVA